MKTIEIADITFREELSRSDCSLSFKEKLEISRQLDKLGADAIEMPPIRDEQVDALLIRSVAGVVANSALVVCAGTSHESADMAWNAVKGAKRSVLQVSLPTGTAGMEYSCHKKAPAMLEYIGDMVSYCAALAPTVEFAAEDATRSEKSFLFEAIRTAIAKGAKIITLCDTNGAMLPDEFADFIAGLRAAVPEIENVTLSVVCRNDLDMAAACAFHCARAGASRIKVSVNGAVYPSLRAVAKSIQTRGDSCGICCGVNTTKLEHILERIVRMTNTKAAAGTPFGAGNTGDRANVSVRAGDDMAALETAVHQLGYELSEEDIAKVYESFCALSKKKPVGARELDAIVATVALQVPPTYKLLSYVINCGNILTPTALIRLEKDGGTVEGLSAGDGPIDAAFLALEQVIGHHYELDDFQIQSVTEGREAMGSALVKLRAGGRVFSGSGISTDIIGASIRAYINALNKIVFEGI